MSPLYLRLALLAFALGAPTAHAIPAAAEIKRIFDALDTSRNDAIGVAEWEQASFAIFKAADANRDNHLSRDEVNAGSISSETFITADANHDGKLSIGEFMNLRRAVFRAADLNGDDFLVLYEYEIFHLLAQFGWQDRNQNGRLDPSELKTALARAFEQLDSDHDGILSPTEGAFLSGPHRAAMEKDSGRLTSEAFVAGYLRLFTGG